MEGVLNTRQWIDLASEWQVGEGSHIFFWKDVWIHSCPLMVSFPLLHEICNQQSILVVEIVQGGPEKLTFRRSFGPNEVQEWQELREIIENIETGQGHDTLIWGLNNKSFSTKFLYRMLTFRGVIDT